MPTNEDSSEKPLPSRGLIINDPESSWAFHGKNYLFIIGIDKYLHWKPLRCAVKDVQDFVKVLTERYQFEQACVYSLLDENATGKNILRTFRELAQKVTDRDNLVIYFSGHGHFDEITRTGYWIPVDAETGHENETQFINVGTVVDRLRSIDSLHTFLIIDACFSSTLIPQFTQIKSSPRSERYKSRRVFTSGRAEVVPDGREGGNSPFASGMLTHLSLNTHKYMPASKLILDVREYVETNAQQTPTEARLFNSNDQGGEFVFHLRMNEAEVWADVVAQHTLEAYEKFMIQFPESKHMADAKEASAWLQAKEKNTKHSLGNYLLKLNRSDFTEKYRSLAIQALYTLEEQACWNEASSKGTLNAYFEYLSKFSSGLHVEEAKIQIEKLLKDEDDMAFKKALDKDSLDAIKEYLENPGDKKYKQEAEKKRSAISLQLEENSREQSAWEIAKDTDTYVAYHNFVQAYPESRFLNEARQKMKMMDDIAWNEIKFLEYDSSLSLQEKINLCMTYFDNFPGAENNLSVKKMKEQFEEGM